MMINNKHNIWLTLGLTLGLSFSLTSCNDWLNLLPNNEQVTERYWQSKEEVEAVIISGYVYMRKSVPTLINWGELRGGDFYYLGSGKPEAKMQDFDLLPTNSLCAYADIYKVISMANSVLEYAPGVRSKDNTYYESMMKSHLCEAYFMRAWAYSVLVKNFKEVPLITSAYVNDNAPMYLPKNSESEIIAQIKEDLITAIDLGAAKGHYEVDWQTKGRATKWALYAAMADICLWNHEYDECIQYANLLIEANDALRPVFMSDPNSWYDLFFPGLSNESIFELYWDYDTESSNNNFDSKFASHANEKDKLNFTPYAADVLNSEYNATLIGILQAGADINGRIGRTYLTTFVGTAVSPTFWKYRGTAVVDATNTRIQNDANFILYRMADVLLMKAEALVMKGEASWPAAIEIINQIRQRAYLGDYIDLEAADVTDMIASLDQLTLLSEVLVQREAEFFGEAHRWYDILRLARYDEEFAPSGTVEDTDKMAYESYNTQGFGESTFKYKNQALSLICQSNNTTSVAQLESVLQDSWAWYLPLPQGDIDANPQLKQNPFYE